MLRSVVALSVAALAGVFVAMPTFARALCGDHAEIVTRLERLYAEKPRAIGLSADGGVLEVFASPTGTWTILITYPQGATCVVATGKSWQAVPNVASGPLI